MTLFGPERSLPEAVVGSENEEVAGADIDTGCEGGTVSVEAELSATDIGDADAERFSCGLLGDSGGDDLVVSGWPDGDKRTSFVLR